MIINKFKRTDEFLLLVFLGTILSIVGIYGILGKFIISNKGLYLYTDNVWSLYGDLSGQLSFSTIDSIHGGYNIFLRMVPSGIIHIFLDRILLFLGIKFTGIVIEKIYFIFLIFLNVNCMLFVTYFLLREHYSIEVSLVGSTFSSFYFMFNPTAIMHIKWPLHWLGYALLPLVFYFSHKIINGRRLKYSVFLGLIVAFLGPLLHWLFFYTFLIIIYIFFNLKRTNETSIVRTLFKFLISFFIFLGITSYFVLPTLYFSSIQGILNPNYVVTSDFIEKYSTHANILNTIRFLGKTGYQPGDWNIISGEGPPSSAIFPYWLTSTFVIPLIFFYCMLNKKNRQIVLYFSIIFILSITLACGTKAPLIGEVYFMLTKLPLGWIFRVPTKWLWISAFSSSILMGYSISMIYSSLLKHKRLVFPLLIGMFVLISLPSWQLFTGDASGITEPVYPPIIDFDRVDGFLKAENSPFKVLWLPFTRYHTWNEKAMLNDLYTISSHQRAIDVLPIGTGIDSRGSNFLRFNLYDSLHNNRMQEAANYLRILGVKYLVWHNDYSGLSPLDSPKEQLDRIFTNIARSNVFELRMTAGSIHLFEIRGFSNFCVSDNTILVHSGLGKLTSLEMVAHQTFSYFFMDQGILNSEDLRDSWLIYENPNIVDILISSSVKKLILNPVLETDYNTPAERWSKGSVLDPWGADWHPYLRNRGITNWQFDYGVGLVFTWANAIVEEPTSFKPEDLITEYDFERDSLEGWYSHAYNISIENYKGEHRLKAVLYEPTSNLKIIRSPPVPVRYGDHYKWEFSIKGMNTYKASTWIVEYNENYEWIKSHYLGELGDSDFDWRQKYVNFSPTSNDTAYMGLDIVPLYNHDDSVRPFPNEVWIDHVQVYNLEHYLRPVVLEIQFEVENTDMYDLFTRYFQSKDGGQISLYLDGNLHQIINTSNQISGFDWDNISAFNLSKGKHRLTIKNDEGFNAINIFMLIPHSETVRLEKQSEEILENKTVIYILEAESDMYYLNAVSSSKYNKEASNGEVLELMTTSKVWSNLKILKSGNYTIAIRGKGDFTVEVDGKDFSVNSSKLDWVYVNPTYLDKGLHKIILTSNQTSDLDVIWIWSAGKENDTLNDIFKVEETPAELIEYTKIDPTKFTLKINASKPFMLSFAEAYDPLWRAYVNGKSIESIPLYSVINGFWIDQTGLFTIIIEYEPQRWFYYGSAISVTTLTASFVYILWDWKKKSYNGSVFKKTVSQICRRLQR